MGEIAIRRLSGALGARVDGVDLAVGRDESIAAIKSALTRHKVLVLPDQQLSPEDLLAFGRKFGEPEVHTFFPTLGDGLEQVTVLDSRAGYRSNRWHADETFLAEPPIITMLHALEIPDYGDDTLWTDMELAFDALSPRLRNYLEGLTAVHDIALQGERDVQLGKNDASWLVELINTGHRAEHPVVRKHPVTGTRSLYVNPVYTRYLVGIPPEENELILPYLFRHCTNPHFVYRHRWSEGDMVIWENRTTLHLAVDAYEGARRMHRVSILEGPSATTRRLSYTPVPPAAPKPRS
jgi:taurine dioxygenase